MSILDSIFGSQQSRGHWAWAGIQQQLHTRSFPQMGCSVCEAEGWIPASKPAPAMATCQQSPDAESTSDPDSAVDHLAFAMEDIQSASTHLTLATADSRVDRSVRKALDALRDALTAVEAEMEAWNGD